MSGRGARARGVSLRTLILGGTAMLVLVTCVALGGLLALATRMREQLDRGARALLAEQQTAAVIGRQVERQLLDAAEYLNDPQPATLDRFRARGQRVYALERRYLFRELSLRERLQVERVKELHQQLEVLAQAAFDARARGDAATAREQAEALFRASEPVQLALDAFLALRAQEYDRVRQEQAAVFRRVYVAAALTGALLLAALLFALRVVRRRILGPVDALARAAERVGAGDLTVRVEPRTDDELARLATSFNAMTAGLGRLQEELRESEERNRRLVELTPDAILVHDAERIRLGNPEAARLFGAPSAAALTAFRLTDLLHPDAPPSAEEQLRSAISDGARAQPLELPFRRLDGERVLGELIAAPFDYEGRPASLVAVRDVTARRQAEEALRATEDRLRQAQKMEAIGRLAGGIAHDFNNLLTVILSECDLLVEDLAAADPRRRDVREIHAAGMRAAALTRQLLTFSRQQVLRPESLDLDAVVRQLAAWLRRLIASDITVVVEVSPSPHVVRADRGQIEQALLNLALNARDAMPRGGRLTIRTTRVELGTGEPDARGDEAGVGTGAEPGAQHVAPGAYVSLSVTDTGVGMDAATRARIFEPFFTTKEVGRGTGLGLATVLGIVQQSGGHVRVESEPGHGSRFEILLPLDAGPAPAPAPSARADALPRGTETVLLAEDDDAVRALARRVLTRQGYTVLDARDGLEASRIAAEHGDAIDLLLTDVVMPGLGGRELADRLRAAHPRLKVLFASGYTADEILRRGIGAQTRRLLEKPYSPRALATRVRETLDDAAPG